MLTNNKHNKSQVSDNHSNDDNHQASKQRENKVWTNYMLVNFYPYPAHGENWVGCGWAANNDKLPIPAIILTIISVFLSVIPSGLHEQNTKLSVECEKGIFVIRPCKVISHHVRFLFHQGPCIVSALLQLTECNLQVESGFLPSTINWSPFSDISAFGSRISLIFSALPDVFWYSILHHHLLYLLRSFFLPRLSRSLCLIKPSASPIFFPACHLSFLHHLS